MEKSALRISPYAPAGESASDVWYESCTLNGAILVSVAYGVHATLFFTCLGALLEQRKTHPKQAYGSIAYIAAHFVLGTTAFACNARFNEMMFVTNRDYPGGPVAFYLDNQSHWTHYTSYFAHLFIAWLQDGLLLWRLFFFWERSYYILIIPVPLFVTSIVVGGLLLGQIGHPGSSIWQTVSFNLFATFWGTELSMTIFVTTMIVGRLVYMRARLKKIMGHDYQSPYLSVAAMLIESGLLYSAGGIVFVVCYARDSAFQNVVLNAVGQIQSIAPVLIILRVAQGRGLTKHSLDATTSNIRLGTHSSVSLQNLRITRRPNHIRCEGLNGLDSDVKLDSLHG